MNHVRPMQVTWPLHRHKPEYIKRQGAEALLLPNRNYVRPMQVTVLAAASAQAGVSERKHAGQCAELRAMRYDESIVAGERSGNSPNICRLIADMLSAGIPRKVAVGQG